MKHSDELSNLAHSLGAFQAAMKAIPQTSTVNAGKYKYSYASLATIWDHIRPVLDEHALSVSQHVEDGGLTTILMHATGEYLMSHASFNGLTYENEKDLGGIISYMRRYALAAVLGLVTDDDNEAHRPPPSDRKKRTQPLKPVRTAPRPPAAPALDPDAWRAKQ